MPGHAPYVSTRPRLSKGPMSARDPAYQTHRTPPGKRGGADRAGGGAAARRAPVSSWKHDTLVGTGHCAAWYLTLVPDMRIA
eukprot:719891-Rhodomonas_salina.1